MAKSISPEVNAGVHSNIGMDFQKNCTIYLFLEKYEQLKDESYFIILEHHEDVIFGFLDAKSMLSKIETYQAKKSSTKWTMSGLFEIIQKITITSQAILDDPHPKIGGFVQENYFATNNTIELKCKIQKQTYSHTINESTERFKYINLDQNIKVAISKGNNEITFTPQNILNLENLHFRFIDLGRTPKSQLEQLNGKFVNVFGEKILDHKAALYTMFYALEEIERELNQGNIAQLNDNKKRIESTQINGILKILTDKKRAYDFWRKKSEEICEALDVSILDQTMFGLHYENSFDKFKDINESEHKKIYDFVKNNTQIFGAYSSDKKCVRGFLDVFNMQKSTTLQSLQLKAIIAAAYTEVKNLL